MITIENCTWSGELPEGVDLAEHVALEHSRRFSGLEIAGGHAEVFNTTFVHHAFGAVNVRSGTLLLQNSHLERNGYLNGALMVDDMMPAALRVLGGIVNVVASKFIDNLAALGALSVEGGEVLLSDQTSFSSVDVPQGAASSAMWAYLC